MGIKLEIKGSIFRDIYEYKNEIIYFKTLLLGKWVSGYKINNVYILAFSLPYITLYMFNPLPLWYSFA
ncbi:MAG: hypothetical protein DRH24_15215 [Deltaproteobacteria bacterium]|nr:MAG: hypothetical protein DRH24_15215 [Deltaproteobacteria bacterium]